MLPVTVSASTCALFQYHRDDASPGKLTTITLNAAHVAAQPVSPNVFGNFIENLHTVIYDTVWADAIHNPSLEKIEDGDGEAPWWDQPGTVRPQPFPMQKNAGPGGAWQLTLPPHALVVLKFAKK